MPRHSCPREAGSEGEVGQSSVLEWLIGTFAQSFPFLEQSNSLSVNFTYD